MSASLLALCGFCFCLVDVIWLVNMPDVNSHHLIDDRRCGMMTQMVIEISLPLGVVRTHFLSFFQVAWGTEACRQLSLTCSGMGI